MCAIDSVGGGAEARARRVRRVESGPVEQTWRISSAVEVLVGDDDIMSTGERGLSAQMGSEITNV